MDKKPVEQNHFRFYNHKSKEGQKELAVIKVIEWSEGENYFEDIGTIAHELEVDRFHTDEEGMTHFYLKDVIVGQFRSNSIVSIGFIY